MRPSREIIKRVFFGQAINALPRGEMSLSDGLVKALAGSNTASFDAQIEVMADLGFDYCCISTLAGREGKALLPPDFKQKVRAAERAGLFVFALVGGVLSDLMNEMGWVSLLVSMKRSPGHYARAAQLRAERESRVIRACKDAGVSGIVIGDDLGYSAGPYISPDDYNRLVAPAHEVLTQASAQLPCVLHSDGAIGKLLHSIRRAGFAGIHPADGILPRDAHEAGLVVLGGFPSAELCLRSPAQVYARALRYAREAEWPHILGSSTGFLGEEVPAANLRALYQALGDVERQLYPDAGRGSWGSGPGACH
ncbi:MAG: uroporphyrinogen decarboxylase family protein [Bacillota bacterium]